MKTAFVAFALLVAGAASAAEPIPAREFVDRATTLGFAELASAKLAKDRSESEAVQAYANRMIVDHTVANDELSKIAAAKGWTLTEPAEEPAEIAKLRDASGSAFDRAYVALQRRGHERMIELLEAGAGDDERLGEWAAKQLPIVRRHLEEARSLEKDGGRPEAALPAKSPQAALRMRIRCSPVPTGSSASNA